MRIDTSGLPNNAAAAVLSSVLFLSVENDSVSQLSDGRAAFKFPAWVGLVTGRLQAAEATDGAKDEPGFGARIAENQRRVFHIAYGVLGNAADAEEVAQEAFLLAFRKFDSLREADKFRAWVNRIAFRLALNRQRGARRRLVRESAWHAAGSSEALDGSPAADQLILLDRLRREIGALPEKFREVLQLSIVADMDATDVGAVLGIPPGTVRSRLHTARKMLLDAMK